MEFSADAGPLYHLPRKFAIVSVMPSLGCLKPLATLEPREGEPALGEAQGLMPRERQASPLPAVGRSTERGLAVDPKGKGKALTPPPLLDSSDD